MFTPQESLQIQQYRAKVNDNTITKEELSQALALLRKGRAEAHVTSAASRTRRATSKIPVNSDSLLNELDGL